jgi:myosin tail region-interacting protein MTI1
VTDPIDPSFHSPNSRSGSTVNLTATTPTQHTQVTEHTTVEPQSEQDVEQVRRTTIAERMAKLGGIKFGAAPILPPTSRPPPPRPDDESGVESSDAPAPEEQAEVDEEEEEELARKERIAAKLAGMGGMRIGMMPLGPGALRPQQSYALKEDNPPVAGYPRAVPPSRPPPPQSDSDPEHEGMSASHHSLSTSEEGVKVEAEESEMEEVSYEDADEEVAPPVPTRSARRGTSDTESTKTPTIPIPRPPVPSMLTRRSSVQTTASGRTSSADSSFSPRRSATMKHRSDYVMVEEPKGLMSDDVPTSSSRSTKPLSRGPSAREAPVQRPTAADISPQWELPSIPSSSLEFGGSTDLSLSWTDAGSPESTTIVPPPSSVSEKPSHRASQIVSADQPLSSDDLMAIWGRVGVQICEVATSLFEKSKKSLVGDGTYHGFVSAAVSEVPNAAQPAPSSYGYVVYIQSGSSVQKRVSDIMPGDIVELQDAKFKGHKGIHTYNQHVGVGESLVGVVSEFEPKKSKIRLFQANQHVGQQASSPVGEFAMFILLIYLFFYFRRLNLSVIVLRT